MKPQFDLVDLPFGRIEKSVRDAVKDYLLLRTQDVVMPGAKYCRPRQLTATYGFGEGTVLSMVERGLLTPIRPSSRMTLYEVAEIEAVIEKIKSGELVLPLDGIGGER